MGQPADRPEWTGHPARRPSGRALRLPRQDRSERPFLVIWEATQACPLACRHCRAEARPHRDPGELTTDQATELMRQVAAFGRPAPLFVITGGDPFQRPDLFELVARGTRMGLAVSVSPSGTPTLTWPALHKLWEAGARAVSLSLDAATAARHDGFRGVDGVYQWTLAAWRHARGLGLKVQINTTVSQHTVGDLPELADLVRTQGALLWSLFPLVPTGRGRSLAALRPDQLEDVINALYDVGATIPVKTTEGHHFKRVWLQRQALAARGADPVEALGLGPLYTDLRARLDRLGLTGDQRVRRPPMRVSAGNGFVFVSHRGEVYPSGFLPISAGTVPAVPGGPAGDGDPVGDGDPALVTIYREAPLFVALRDPDRLGGRCGRCEFRAVCGGSRARAYAATGDVLAEDPACGYRPGSFPFPLDLDPWVGSSR